MTLNLQFISYFLKLIFFTYLQIAFVAVVSANHNFDSLLPIKVRFYDC